MKERAVRTQVESWAKSHFSRLGRKITAPTGIGELMDDLGQALTTDPHMRMLGGGNPAIVPEMQALFRRRMEEMLGPEGGFDQMLAHYEPPRGNPRFLQSLAHLLQRSFGWDIGPQNIAVTNGAQSACFFLFNLLAGRFSGSRRRKILLPQAPEYIGYADQGVEPDLFTVCRPQLEWLDGPDGRIFKYRIDFQAVEEVLRSEDIGAIVVSRPTNPTGNVLTDAEVTRLSALAAQWEIPLLLDSAYGAPFPGVFFVSAEPYWAPHVILTLSLSKLGLPGTRTGIVIAPEPIAAAISAFTAVVGLANGNLGQQLVLPWIEDGSILDLGPRILRPFYESKSRAAMAWATESFRASGVHWAMHASEGAFFHWLWFPRLRLSARELYARLKIRQVLTVPGEYFFYGFKEDWPHRQQCLRLNFSQPASVVREGLQIIAEEAAKAQD